MLNKIKNVFTKKNYKPIKIKFNRGDRVLLNWDIWIDGKLKKGTVVYAETNCFGVRYGVKLDNDDYDDHIYSFGDDILIKLDKNDNIEINGCEASCGNIEELKTYIKELEARVEKLENNLSIICTDINAHLSVDHDYDSDYCRLE